MRYSRLTLAISATLAAGTSLAAIPTPGVVTVDTTGVGHVQTIVQDGANPGSGHIQQSGVGGHDATISQGSANPGVEADIHQEGDDASNTAAIFQTTGETGASVATIHQSGAGNIAGIDSTGDGGLTIEQGLRSPAVSFGNDATIQTTGANTDSTVNVLQDGVFNKARVSLSDSDDVTVNVSQGGFNANAMNSATVSVTNTDGAVVEVLQDSDSRNDAEVIVTDNTGTVNLESNQIGEGGSTRTIVKRNATSSLSNVEQAGTDNIAISRFADNIGDASVSIMQSGQGNLARGIIEDSSNAVATVDQDGLSSEANVVITLSDSATGTIDQTGGSDNYANIAINEGIGSTGTINQSGNNQTVGMQLFGDLLSQASATQVGNDSSAAIKANNSQGAIIETQQYGDNQSLLAKVRGGSIDSEIYIAQGVNTPSLNNRAEVSIRRDTDGSVVMVQQELQGNKANIVIDEVDSFSTTQVGQIGDDNSADVFVQQSGGSASLLVQEGTDNVAFMSYKGDVGSTMNIGQAGHTNVAKSRLEASDGSNVEISQFGNENTVDVDNSSAPGVVISVGQISNSSSAEIVFDSVDAGMVAIMQGGNGGHSAVVSARNFSDASSTTVNQEGTSNSASITMAESSDASVIVGQSGNDGSVEIDLIDSDNISSIEVNQAGVSNSVMASLNQADVDSILVDQSDSSSNSNSATLELLESDGLVVAMMQVGDYNVASLTANESDDSSLVINQNSGGLGHVANVLFSDADDSSFTITQSGFDNEANVVLSQVNDVIGNLVQGGYGNTMDVTITTNGDNFDSTTLALDQSACFECHASYSN